MQEEKEMVTSKLEGVGTGLVGGPVGSYGQIMLVCSTDSNYQNSELLETLQALHINSPKGEEVPKHLRYRAHSGPVWILTTIKMYG